VSHDFAMTPAPEAPKRKRRRVFLWVFLAIQVAFIIWIISAGAAGDHSTTHCVAKGLTTGECKGTSEAATGIAIFLQIVIWIVVDFFVALTYAIYRLARRTN
jgi:hypothetical protein